MRLAIGIVLRPLLVHHENQRVGPAEDYDQVRMGIPRLTVIFRGASSGRRGRPTARLTRLAFARRMFIPLICRGNSPTAIAPLPHLAQLIPAADEAPPANLSPASEPRRHGRLLSLLTPALLLSRWLRKAGCTTTGDG